MPNIRFSERDVAFPPSKMLDIGKKYGWLHRWRHPTSSPAMVLIDGPDPIRDWAKTEGDLCYVVLEKYTQGWLLSLNRTNWLKWVLLPQAEILEMKITEEGKHASGMAQGSLIINATAGPFNFEIVYGQLEKVRTLIQYYRS